MSIEMTIVKKKIWDMIMLFVITNGFGGAILLVQDMRNRGAGLANRKGGAPSVKECAA